VFLRDYVGLDDLVLVLVLLMSLRCSQSLTGWCGGSGEIRDGSGPFYAQHSGWLLLLLL